MGFFDCFCQKLKTPEVELKLVLGWPGEFSGAAFYHWVAFLARRDCIPRPVLAPVYPRNNCDRFLTVRRDPPKKAPLYHSFLRHCCDIFDFCLVLKFVKAFPNSSHWVIPQYILFGSPGVKKLISFLLRLPICFGFIIFVFRAFIFSADGEF